MEIKGEEKKKQLSQVIEQVKQELWDLSDKIHDFAERGYEERQSAEVLIRFLERHGFAVTAPFAGLETAFRGVCSIAGGTEAGGVNIGLLCEYDSLDIGHGCAHHMQGPVILGAALALKEICAFPVQITVIGTPAEECQDGGKNPMNAQHAFDGLDFTLMVHGGHATQIDGVSLALMEFDVEFFGRASHAGVAPEEGRSALEAALLMQNAVAFLRAHVTSDVRMNVIVLDGGHIVNSVTPYAKCKVDLRADDMGYLEKVYERVRKIIEGSALSTETTFQITPVARLRNTVICDSLADLVLDNAEYYGCPNLNRERNKPGSTDYGIVGYQIPSCCLRVPVIEGDAPAHTVEWVENGKSEQVHTSILYGAKALAGAAYDAAECRQLVEKMQKDYPAGRKS